MDLDALDAAQAAATTNGEWWVDGTHAVKGNGWLIPTGAPANAALIVAAVNALPDLIAEVRRGRALREEHDELRHRLKALVDEWDAMARNLHHVPVAEAYADVVIGLRAALAAVDGGEQ